MLDSVEFNDITCPVCGLACDDLRVVVNAGGVQAFEPACPISKRYFSAAWPSDAAETTPTINGASTTLKDAVARAAELLTNANAPIISGLVTDVDGARAALALADRFGASVDHRGSDALFRNLRVVQDSGWFTTTLSEVRNRADLVVIVGANVFAQFPRFAERVLKPDGLFISTKRRIVLIGPWPSDPLPDELTATNTSVISLPVDSIAEVASLLRLFVKGITVSNVTTLPIDSLTQLASWLNDAGYSVIAWSSADLDFSHAELAVENWCELIRDLNRSTRAAGLPLGGGDGGLSANQVCTWQAGFPLRTSFTRGYPEHDAWRYDGARMMRDNETDLQVWLATLTPDTVPNTDSPQIVIGHPGLQFKKTPEVYIPTGIPGIDHAGHCFRTDGVVALPLRKLIKARWPSAREVIDQLLEARHAD